MKVFLFGGSEELGEYVLKQLAERGHETVTVAENKNRAEELKMFGAAEHWTHRLFEPGPYR